MRPTIDGHEVESLSVALTDAEGKTSEHAIAASALIRALTGELGTSMREVSLTTARAQVREVRKTVNADALEGYGDFLKAGDEAGGKGRDPRGQDRESLALPKGETPRVSGGIAPCSADVPCSPYLEKNGKSVEPLNDDPGGHTPPPPARYRGSSAAHPPPLRCAHGSGPPRPAHGGRRARSRPPLRPCIAPRLGSAGSAFVSLPAQVSRLRRLPFAAVAHSGCAVCSSRRAHTQPPLWAGPDGSRPLRRAGRALAAARTPLRRTGRCSVVSARGRWWGVGADGRRPAAIPTVDQCSI